MRRALVGALASALVTVVAPAAAAHVTVQPNEAIAGTFSRFVVRVPNEKPAADTTKVVVNMPPLAFVSFEPKDGWERDVEMVELDEPIEAFGQEIAEAVGSVTWSGGRIGPGEFLEFGFSARMPDAEETLTFEALQTYTGGEVVRWTGAADSETPAATVTTYDLGLEEGEGQIALLAELASADTAAAPDDTRDADEDADGGSGLGTILGGVALAVALAALVLALRRPSAATHA